MPEGAKRCKLEIVAAVLIITVGIGLTLFAHWELTSESWICWFFARIFTETGKFIIIGRGPLFTLYLNLFRWMGYPTSVMVEYVVTTLIMVISMIILFRKHTGWFWAAFAFFLWLPFFQFAEPPTQKLALALSCLAIAVRDAKVSRFRLAISYALLGLACLMRSTYVVFMLIFIIYDSIKILRQKKIRGFLATIRPTRYDWPVLLMLILFAWFNFMQSPHRWNNTSSATATWFPDKNKSLTDAAFIHHYNCIYILHKYGSYESKDYYLTNKELFNGATTMLGAIRANPRFVASQFVRNNIKGTIGLAVNFTMLPRVYKQFSKLGYFYYAIALLLILLFIFVIFYGLFLAYKKNRNMFLFFIANISLIGTTTIIVPKERYMHPLVPLLIFSAFWLGEKIGNILKEKQVSSRRFKPLFSICSYLAIPVFLILFSSGRLTGANWGKIIADIRKDISSGRVKIMESRPYSNKASFKSIQSLVNECNGVLSLENQFFGAFLDVPMDKIYDIWEIPPFGSFGDSGYTGLYPERIDCILVSHNLATESGSGTNCRIRYLNFIKHYIKQLKDRGAIVYKIDSYGEAVILPKKNKGLKHEQGQKVILNNYE